MNTREIAVEYRLSHWAGIMRERKESGLSVKAFCEKAGFHENIYYYWQRRLREAACGELAHRNGDAVTEGPTFAQIRPPVAGSGGGAITVRMGDAVVEIAGDAPATTVETVLRALGKC